MNKEALISPGEMGIESKEKKEFGKDVEIRAVFRRHFDPKKDPATGRSLDELTEEGRQRAIELGKELTHQISESGIKIYFSPTARAKESAQLILSGLKKNAEGTANIINQKITDRMKIHGVKAEPEPGPFIIREKKDLSVLKLGKDYSPYFSFKNPQEPDPAKKIKKSLDESIEYWLRNPDLSGETTSPLEIASNLANRIDTYIKMSKRLYENSSILMENITHGPNPEAFLREVLIRKIGDKEIRGFENLSEIGGSFKPGEGFEVIIKRENINQAQTRLAFRGQEYGIDMNRLKELVNLANQPR